MEMESGPEYRRWWAEIQNRIARINAGYARLKLLKAGDTIPKLSEKTESVNISQKGVAAMGLNLKKSALRDLFVAIGYREAGKWPEEKIDKKLGELPEEIEEEGVPESLDADEKKLLTKLLKALEDETLNLIDDDDSGDDDDDAPTPAKKKKKAAAAAEDDDGDDDDSDDDSDDDNDDDDDDEPAPKKKKKPAPADDDGDSDDDDDDEPAPKKQKSKKAGGEEFVGMRELVAILTVIAGLLQALLEKTGGKKSAKAETEDDDDEPAPRKRKAAEYDDDDAPEKWPLKKVIAEIRKIVSARNTAKKSIKQSEIFALLKEKVGDWDAAALKKRIKMQVESRMENDGIDIRKANGGYWVAEESDE